MENFSASNAANDTPEPGSGQGDTGKAGGPASATGTGSGLFPERPGATPLPHQSDPLRHEGIREAVTEPPAVPVSPDDYDHLPLTAQVPPLPVLSDENIRREAEQNQYPNIAGRGHPTPAPLAPPVEPGLLAIFATRLAQRLQALRSGRGRFRAEEHAAKLETIMDFAARTTAVTNDDVERLTGVHHAQACNLLRELVRQGRLERFGRFKHTVYRPSPKTTQ